MTCREFVEFLDAYLGDFLSASERAEFEKHLAACRACVNYLDSYRKTIALGRAAFESSEDVVPNGIPQDLVLAILAARERSG